MYFQWYVLTLINGQQFSNPVFQTLYVGMQCSFVERTIILYGNAQYNVLCILVSRLVMFVHSADDIVAINKPSGYSVHGKLQLL